MELIPKPEAVDCATGLPAFTILVAPFNNVFKAVGMETPSTRMRTIKITMGASVVKPVSPFVIFSGFSPRTTELSILKRATKANISNNMQRIISHRWPVIIPAEIIMNLLKKILKGGTPTRANAPPSRKKLVTGATCIKPLTMSRLRERYFINILPERKNIIDLTRL